MSFKDCVLNTNEKKTNNLVFEFSNQFYTGDTLYNNIHGSGFYFHESERLFYDGRFYANKLEGYCQVFYSDGSHFQGLFKDNKRFGPGVLTYPNGQTDIGLWKGSQLVRLSKNPPLLMHQLTNTALGKTKVLKYRYLVPVSPQTSDGAADVLQDLGANEVVLKKSDEMYNKHVKNKNNSFFNRKLYDEAFYGNQDNTIVVAQEEVHDQSITQEETDECIDDNTQIHLKRIDQISSYIENIAPVLESIRTEKNKIQKKVSYCTEHCHPSNNDENEQAKVKFTDVYVEEESITRERSEHSIAKISPTLSDFILDDSPLVVEESNTPPDKDLKHDCLNLKSFFGSYCYWQGEGRQETLLELKARLDVLTKDEKFYETVYKYLNTKMMWHRENLRVCRKLSTKTVVVNQILAWNNESLCMKLLQHSFLHRQSEYMVCFKVEDILAGKCGTFQDCGAHEIACLDFLTECYSGKAIKVIEFLNYDMVAVNVTDSRGNSGVFFAVAKCKTNIIRLLTKFGANMSQINDEGVTPLNMCLLMYLSSKYGIDDWEASFLPTTKLNEGDIKEIQKWYPSGSFCSRVSFQTNPKTYGISVSIADFFVQEKSEHKHVFHMASKPMIPSSAISSYFFEVPPKEVFVSNFSSDDDAEINPLGPIEDTCFVLLECGANPNIGEVPFPSLIISIFSENVSLVKAILGAKADVNVTMPEENLNSLHITVGLGCAEEIIEICGLLLEHSCDPNHKCSPTHWPQEKERILGKNTSVEDFEDLGKNPLHMLCLRQDFKNDNCNYFIRMAIKLIKNGTNLQDNYLGHNALSLAVLSGNVNVVKGLVNGNFIDPYKELGYNMGNILTLYGLKRYNNILPLQKCKDILDLLVDLGVNPLEAVGSYQTAIDFLNNADKVIGKIKKSIGKGKKSKGKEKDKKGKGNDKKKTKSKMSKTSSQNKKKEYGNFTSMIKKHIVGLARQVILNRVKMEVTHFLYNLAEEDMLKIPEVTDKSQFDDSVVAEIVDNINKIKPIAEYLNVKQAQENLHFLYAFHKIEGDRFDKLACQKVLDFVDTYGHKEKKKQKQKKANKNKKNKKTRTTGKSATSTATASSVTAPVTEKKMEYNYETAIAKPSNKKLFPPGLDDASKYNVCFVCCKKIPAESFKVCPLCEMILFCSDKCLKAANKLKSGHPCKPKKQATSAATSESLTELVKKISERCQNRLQQRRLEKLEEEKKKMEEQRKLDIYGTNAIKKIREVARGQLTSTLVSLYGSLADNYIDKLKGESPVRENKWKQSTGGQFPTGSTGKTSSKKVKKECIRCNKLQVSKEDLMPKKFVKIPSKFEPLPWMEEPYIIHQKFNKIPPKPQYFVELLSTFLPDIDISGLLLPYVCYVDGHLYSRFADDNLFLQAYNQT